ncbi:putative nuclease HARBI1 [Penaeus monodon]|uniref:putative nuclease HARBI1 n=1 Tax=Penaeus monodon TaxID=6687 RepID=UPI0018A6DF43|nr:putative nuclease HARBI1 [Penaeus monodon]
MDACGTGIFYKMELPNLSRSHRWKTLSIRPPRDSGSYFFNYKGTHSIVLLAVCDANLEFIYVDIGANGRVSDGGVWNNSDLCRRIANNTAGLPTDKHVLGSDRILPYVFVADDAFQLQRHILKPFHTKTKHDRKEFFLIDFPRAKRTVENASGILTNRFRVFLTPISLSPGKIEKVVLACTALHNYLRRDFGSHYTPKLLELQRCGSGSTTIGNNIRTQYMDYFNAERAVQ